MKIQEKKLRFEFEKFKLSRPRRANVEEKRGEINLDMNFFFFEDGRFFRARNLCGQVRKDDLTSLSDANESKVSKVFCKIQSGEVRGDEFT